ncbi:endonuclease/exonuclease/phosphatase family protein [Microvirga lotononidis]|uniref:Metal-dependent hydrolase n=1 Tax=Microvirga lotononidis TaxID=864069 RepID=I4Z4M2_9HYPH|nr:endonuclease/exonuclease/phosphatase family protein [Microvirga lotononidis]EIM31164.1 metal-dependent hydrolase [Microvirga lotononidis]WQO30445.1 endonuclease/exonuclease/phosphatase family protein [Microvirga lotononidis]
MIRLATYNVENLFARAKILDRHEWADGKGTSRMEAAREILDAVAELNGLLAQAVYTSEVKREILNALETLDLLDTDENKFLILRRNRGHLLKRPKNGPVFVAADGRDDWIGWIEMKTEAVSEVATQNTARVIGNINADIIAVVEAENRTSLLRFNEQVITPITALNYQTIMLVDGNDDRGIDVGILCRDPILIDFMRSHVDDRDGTNRIFSRDCVEYHMRLPSGDGLVILVNHLKSKGYGRPRDSNARRKRQAMRVREIYDDLIDQGISNIAIVGDLNDTPDSGPLFPLLGDGLLRDVSEHPSFTFDGRPGTYANGTASQKIDYILLSPNLFQRVRGGAIYRKGVWGGANGSLFPHFPEITKEVEAASDHAAIYADLDM